MTRHGQGQDDEHRRAAVSTRSYAVLNQISAWGGTSHAAQSPTETWSPSANRSQAEQLFEDTTRVAHVTLHERSRHVQPVQMAALCLAQARSDPAGHTMAARMMVHLLNMRRTMEDEGFGDRDLEMFEEAVLAQLVPIPKAGEDVVALDSVGSHTVFPSGPDYLWAQQILADACRLPLGVPGSLTQALLERAEAAAKRWGVELQAWEDLVNLTMSPAEVLATIGAHRQTLRAARLHLMPGKGWTPQPCATTWQEGVQTNLRGCAYVRKVVSGARDSDTSALLVALETVDAWRAKLR
jgi:hypothetical protein